MQLLASPPLVAPIAVALLALLGGGPSCQMQGCTEEAVNGLSVRVLDAATDQPICDAKVTATDGAHSELLSLFPGSQCVYSGATERAGTYQITVERNGYLSATRDSVTVTEDDCHVDPQVLTLELTPQTP